MKDIKVVASPVEEFKQFLLARSRIPSQRVPAIIENAVSMGVKLMRPYIVTAVTGSSEEVHGRVKHMVLTLKAWDQEKKGVDVSAKAAFLKANLLIIAIGAGAAEDKIVTETLGFGYEKLKPVNYMALGLSTTANSQMKTAIMTQSTKPPQESPGKVGSASHAETTNTCLVVSLGSRLGTLSSLRKIRPYSKILSSL